MHAPKIAIGAMRRATFADSEPWGSRISIATEATKLKKVSSHNVTRVTSSSMRWILGRVIVEQSCALPVPIANRNGNARAEARGVRPLFGTPDSGRAQDRPGRVLDVLEAAQGHGHIEFLADDFEGQRHPRLAHRAQAVKEGLPDHR